MVYAGKSKTTIQNDNNDNDDDNNIEQTEQDERRTGRNKLCLTFNLRMQQQK